MRLHQDAVALSWFHFHWLTLMLKLQQKCRSKRQSYVSLLAAILPIFTPKKLSTYPWHYPGAPPSPTKHFKPGHFSKVFQKQGQKYQKPFDQCADKVFFQPTYIWSKNDMKTTYPFSPVFQNDMFSDIQRTTKIGDFLEKNTIWPSENHVFRLFNWEFEYKFVHIAQNQKLRFLYGKM